jgi:predicted N-formylglutamate amidohydrolase
MPAAAPVPAMDDWPEPVEVLNEAGRSDIVLLCEHASRHLPAEYSGLGLGEADLSRHIAWDIGAAAVTRSLALRLDAAAFLGTYSRLIIDLNRPIGAASAMPTRSEATDVPGNARLTATERERRHRLIHAPYHERVAVHLDRRVAAGRPTTLVTIHSFTPVFLGVARPWHAGILFDRSRTFAHAVIAGLARDPSLVVAANEPYTVDRDSDYAIPVHGTDRGLPAILVEIRNDLIDTDAGVAEWVERLAVVLPAADRGDDDQDQRQKSRRSDKISGLP